LFEGARDRFKDSETYRLDLVALRLQQLSNEALGAAQGADQAARRRDRGAFEDASGRLLRLGSDADSLLDSEPFFRLATYRGQALRYGDTDAERRSSLRNAMALVTYWAGSDRNADELHDYAFKAWSGMMSSYSTERWRLYFESVRRGWDGGNAEPTDFFAWERQWAEANSLP
jgi:alpha-N-acetylglucosaminidase